MTLKVTKDTVGQVLASIQRLVGQEVLVGIPASEAERNDEDPKPMNNAQLGYVHENGSPAQNIPARPFLIPGVEDTQKSYTSHLQKAVTAALNGDNTKVQTELNAAGLVASSGARHKITTGDFEPLSPATIRNRRKSRSTKSMRAAEKKYLELIANGATPEQAQDEAGIRPLINTGQLRNSLTYVVRRKGRS